MTALVATPDVFVSDLMETPPSRTLKFVAATWSSLKGRAARDMACSFNTRPNQVMILEDSKFGSGADCDIEAIGIGRNY